MKTFYLKEIQTQINSLNIKDGARLRRTRQLFEDYGFQIGPKYIKKIVKNIWELRAGKVRLFLYIEGNDAYGVHLIIKKSQKLPKNDINLAIKRSKKI
ncbi:MAG: type II toxin-antitoxin system RelE/ParE family toxin [Patescibacteria group bacterium]